MNVYRGNGALHCTEDVTIVEGWKAVRKTTLNTDLGGAQFPGRSLEKRLRAQGDGLGRAVSGHR